MAAQTTFQDQYESICYFILSSKAVMKLGFVILLSHLTWKRGYNFDVENSCSVEFTAFVVC